MTKTPSKTATSDTEKPKKTKSIFKPDVRLAHAIVGAIAFLQKAGLHATPRIIKKCINERSRKSFSKSIEHLPWYLNRGLELGILKKRHGSFKLGVFQIKKRPVKKKQPEKHEKTVEVIKDFASNFRTSSESAFY